MIQTIEATTFEKYPAYKDSGVEWLGEIPEHWKLSKIKYVVKEHSGCGFPLNRQGLDCNEVPFYKVSDINGNEKFVKSSNNYVDWDTIKREKWNIVPKHSIVAGKIGEALRKNHRKITLTDSIIDNNCIAIEATNIDYNFNYYLQLIIDFDWFSNPGAVPSMSILKYKNFIIPIPSPREQTTIATFLDDKTSKIDTAIAQKEQMIALLKERKQIVIQNAVTGKWSMVNGKWGETPKEKMKDSGVEWIGEIPEHWEVSRLGLCLKPYSVKNRPDLPLLSITRELGVIVRDIDDQESNHNYIPDDLSGYKVIRKGQFGMNKMKAWQGSYGVSDYDGIISPAYYVFDLITDIEPVFFHKAIRSYIYVPFFASASDGVRIGQWDLNKSRMKEIPIIIPPNDEQMNLPAASGRGIMMDYRFYFSPQAAGNLTLRD